MPETVQQADVMTDVSQSAYVEDFFNDANYELVDDKGNPLSLDEGKNAEAAKTETNQKKEPQPAQQAKPAEGQKPPEANAQEQQKPAETKAEETKRLEIEKGFYDEQGNLKDDVFDFFGVGGDGFKYEPKIEPQAQMQQPKPGEQDVPEWKRQMDQERTYRDTIRQNLFGPIARIKEYISQGYTAEQAAQQVEAEYGGILNDHFSQRDYEQRYAEKEAQAKEIARTTEMAKLEPISSSNQAEIAAKMGGIEKYQQLMFSPEVGGPVLRWLFDQMNPDKAKMPPEKLGSELNSWWTRFSADKNNLNFAVKMALSNLQQRMFPDMVKRIRANAQAQTAQHKEGAIGAPGRMPANTASLSPDDQPDEVDKYLSGHIDEI
ncbi:hypothetical protein CCP3SC15_300029 [Gammaproteobacteria bacterium]